MSELYILYGDGWRDAKGVMHYGAPAPATPATAPRPAPTRFREPTSPALVEQVFGAPVNVLHEASHAITAALLNLNVVSVYCDRATGEGTTAVLHRSDDPDDVRRMTSAFAAAPVFLLERCGLSMQFAQCADDIDHVAVLERHHDRLVGAKASPISGLLDARRVLDTPAFAAGMHSLLPVLAEKELVSGDEVRALLSEWGIIEL